MASEWDSQSAGPSFNPTADACGPVTTLRAAQPSSSAFPPTRPEVAAVDRPSDAVEERQALVPLFDQVPYQFTSRPRRTSLSRDHSEPLSVVHIAGRAMDHLPVAVPYTNA
jgi:hypothetical protein